MSSHSNKYRVLVTLANHEIPPRVSTPGIGQLIHRQLEAMDTNTFDITSVCIKTNPGDLIEVPQNYTYNRLPLSNLGFNCIRFIPKRLRRFLFGINDAKKIYRNLHILFFALKNIRKFDVVIVHNYPLTAIWLFKLKSVFNPRLKVLYYYHSSDIDRFIGIYPGLLKMDGIITIAGEHATKLKDIPTVNIINNYSKRHHTTNTISAVEHHNTIKLVSSCNIEPNKGLLLVCEALTKLPAGIHYSFDMYGTVRHTEYYNQLMNLTKPYPLLQYKGLVNNVDLIGKLSEYDLAILFSQELEGNGMSIIEAIVEAELPVIGSNLGGIPLVLNQEAFGFIVNNYQSSEELALLLTTIYQNQNLLTEKKVKIKDEAAFYFSPQRSAELLGTFIQQVCG